MTTAKQTDPQPNPPPGIVAAFVAALAELRPPAFDRSNPAFRSRYATLASHVDASRPTLARHGLALVQPVEPDGCGHLVVRTRLYHGPTGDTMELGAMPFTPHATDPQKTITCLTYFRRASLAAALGFVGEEDDDAEAISGPLREEAERRRNPPPPVSVAQAVARTVAAKVEPVPKRPRTDNVPPPDGAVSIGDTIATMTVPELAKPNPAAWHDGDNGRPVEVIRYATKSGTTRGREWTRHAVLIDDAGAEVWASTFDTTIGETAKSLVNCSAEIVTKPIPGGVEILRIRAWEKRPAQTTKPNQPQTTEVPDDAIPF